MVSKLRLPLVMMALTVFPCSGYAEGDPPIGILLAAGDIANCGSARSRYAEVALRISEEVAKADRDGIPIRVIALGDLAYRSGSHSYQNCLQEFDKTWGEAAGNKLLPIPGNHDYSDDSLPHAGSYFSYFQNFYESLSIKSDGGSYVYEFPEGAPSAWLLIGYNYYGDRRQELKFLKDRSASFKNDCVVGFSHVFYLSSGHHGSLQTNNTLRFDRVRPFVDLLRSLRGDIFLSAHDHDYEVFGPQDDAAGTAQGTDLRQFVVGTGGAPLYGDKAPVPHPLSVEFQNTDHGFIKITLYGDHYEWSFVSTRVSEDRVSTSHTGNCN